MKPAEPKYKCFIICTAPRSGSTMLCKMLKNTAVAGNPDSYFHRPSTDNWLDVFGLGGKFFSSESEKLRAIFAAAQSQGDADTGIFGLRMQRGSAEYFLKQLTLLHPKVQSDENRINATFGQTLFIHLSRQNKLEQAVSLLKAEQSGLWHKSSDGRVLEQIKATQLSLIHI